MAICPIDNAQPGKSCFVAVVSLGLSSLQLLSAPQRSLQLLITLSAACIYFSIPATTEKATLCPPTVRYMIHCDDVRK
jgi:hypothetical protein